MTPFDDALCVFLCIFHYNHSLVEDIVCEIIERMPALNQLEALSKQASSNNQKVIQPAMPVHPRSQDGT